MADSAPPLRGTIDDIVTLPAPQLAITPLPEPVPVPRRKKVPVDPYAPTGIGLGNLSLYPSLNIGTTYTSNVSKAPKGAQGDVGLRVRPALRFDSDWSRHAWSGAASGDWVWYEDQAELDSRKADISTRYRLDIRHHTRAEFDASYSLDQSGIEDSEVPDAAIGNRTDHLASASVAGIHDFGRLEARLKAGAAWRLYEDVELAGGGSEDNSDRDYVEPLLSVRTTYTDPPSLRPFVELAYTPRLHEQTIDRSGLRRDSEGASASLGLTVDHGPIWAGEVAVAYLVRDYRDDSLDTIRALGLDANLNWSPTELTMVILTAATALGETASATSSGTRNWRFGSHLRHAFRDNLDLLAGVDVEFEKHDRGTDVTFDTGVGFEWALNPSWAWTLSYDATWFNSAVAGGDYEEHRFSVGMTIQR